MTKYLNTNILEGNIYTIIDNFCDDLQKNIAYYKTIDGANILFIEELDFIIMYIKYDFINKTYEMSTCECFENSICYINKGKCTYDAEKLKDHTENIKTKYMYISVILEKFINIFRDLYITISNESLKNCIMIIIYGLYNLWNTIYNLVLYINSFRNNYIKTNGAGFAISQIIIFLNYKNEIKQRYFFVDKTPNTPVKFNNTLMDIYIRRSNMVNTNLYEIAATDILLNYNSILVPVSLTGGNIKNKYKNTKNKITVIYNKKKYTRVIFICDRKKYVKIDKTFMLLSKLKKV